MSADNWGTCPRCLEGEKKRRILAKKKAREAYGKVTPEEYEALKAEAQGEESVGQTLREDYELGVEPDGKFMVRYYANCEKCGWGHEYRHDAQLDITSSAEEKKSHG